MTTWLRLREAADYVKVSTDIIRAAVKNGDLPAYPVGSGRREYRLTAEDIDTWMKSRSWEPRGSYTALD
jgi:excisionase family DNA binding protein